MLSRFSLLHQGLLLLELLDLLLFLFSLQLCHLRLMLGPKRRFCCLLLFRDFFNLHGHVLGLGTHSFLLAESLSLEKSSRVLLYELVELDLGVDDSVFHLPFGFVFGRGNLIHGFPLVVELNLDIVLHVFDLLYDCVLFE